MTMPTIFIGILVLIAVHIYYSGHSKKRGITTTNHYFESPSREVFIDLKDSAIKLWSEMSTNYSFNYHYIDEVQSLANISGNFMRMVQMFGLDSRRELAQMVKEDTKREIFIRLEAIGDVYSYIFKP